VSGKLAPRCAGWRVAQQSIDDANDDPAKAGTTSREVLGNPFVVPPLGGSFKPVVPIQAWLRLVIQFMLGIGNAHIYHQDMSRDARYEVN
jgi:hypothetical protein